MGFLDFFSWGEGVTQKKLKKHLKIGYLLLVRAPQKKSSLANAKEIK
jgi:hypothetical protein